MLQRLIVADRFLVVGLRIELPWKRTVIFRLFALPTLLLASEIVLVKVHFLLSLRCAR